MEDIIKFCILLFTMIILASILRCDEGGCDCTCGQGEKVRNTLQSITQSTDKK